MLIVDAHEDLGWNMLTFGRDYTRPAAQTRLAEAGSGIDLFNGDSLLGWPDYLRGRVGVVFGTLFATPQRFCNGPWDTQCYRDARQARRLYQAQLDAYERLFDGCPDKFRAVRTQQDLQAVLEGWKAPEAAVGVVTLMEGAEAVQEPAELEEWWQRGVRLIGPAWAGTRFCGGTKEPGPLTKEGYALLDGMAELGFTLDLSHMDEMAALQALDSYPGRIIASHSNALAVLKGSDSNRHLSDRVIRGILERGGVIGIVLFNKFLKQGWKQGDRRDEVGLEHVVIQIDYLCQMSGDACHVGIGSDFDGGFGWQSTPREIDTVADLTRLDPLLTAKGYSAADISAILGENWLDHLRQSLPES